MARPVTGHFPEICSSPSIFAPQAVPRLGRDTREKLGQQEGEAQVAQPAWSWGGEAQRGELWIQAPKAP